MSEERGLREPSRALIERLGDDLLPPTAEVLAALRRAGVFGIKVYSDEGFGLEEDRRAWINPRWLDIEGETVSGLQSQRNGERTRGEGETTAPLSALRPVERFLLVGKALRGFSERARSDLRGEAEGTPVEGSPLKVPTREFVRRVGEALNPLTSEILATLRRRGIRVITLLPEDGFGLDQERDTWITVNRLDVGNGTASGFQSWNDGDRTRDVGEAAVPLSRFKALERFLLVAKAVRYFSYGYPVAFDKAVSARRAVPDE